MKWVRVDYGTPGTELPGGLRTFSDERRPHQFIRAEATPHGVYALYRRAYWWRRIVARRQGARPQPPI